MRFLATALLSFTASFCYAQNGYEIKVTLKPFKNQYIYLGHYYGKQLPIIDSAKLNDKSEAVFKGPKKLGGGIYLVGYPDRSRNFEILIDKNQKFSITADTANIRALAFQNSPENIAFKQYQETMTKNGMEVDALYKKRAGAKPEDSIKINGQIEAINTNIRKYRSDLIAKDPNGLLAALLKAMKEPDVPQNDPAAKKDTLFAYHYFKKHYWDGVNFYDERLARTPFFESRVDKYYEQLVYPAADSVIKEIDYMMGYASSNEEMEKFLLLKFVNRYLNQKYMWEDAVFVHLFEKYFSQKTYSWLTDKGKKIITDRAYSLMANIMGTPASDIELPDTTGKKINLYSVDAPYTLVTIWDPTCSHCKETLPRLDSMYQAKWKGYGLKFFSLAKETDGSKKDWLSFIHNHKLDSWINVLLFKRRRPDAGEFGYTKLLAVV
jgi:hypothetical protein